MPYKYKTIEKINVLYCTSVTKQCFHVKREKCVCLTYGLPFGNKCIHLNQNGMFFTITVFCTPDVRNMLLEEQTKNLEWLILPKACMYVVPYSRPCLSSCSVSSPGVGTSCLGAWRICVQKLGECGTLFAHRRASFPPGLCPEESATSSHTAELHIAVIMRQIPSRSCSSPKDFWSFMVFVLKKH